MKRRTGFLVVGLSGVLLGLVPTSATQDPQAQNPNNEVPVPIPTNKFLDGWMAELLHADHKQAERAYLSAMDAPDLPDHQSTLSILRLWESNWIRNDRARYQRTLEDRGLYYTEGRPTWNSAEFQRKTVGFARAIAEDDEEQLAILRKSVADYVAENPVFRSRRKLVKNALPDLRQPAGPDPILEGLKRLLTEARAKGDRNLEVRLRRRIQRRGSQARQDRRQLINTLQLIGKRWAQMTRLHLEGRHRRAEAFESLMGNRDRFARRGTIPTQDFYRNRIGNWDGTARQAKLASVVRRLTDEYPLTSPSLTDQERDVLTALRQKITELQASSNVEEALQLVARTPYRGVLLRRGN